MGVNKRLIGAGAAGGAFVNDENFRVVTYTGNSSTQSITGVGFQPDFVWIKERSQAENHNLIDSSRGTSKILSSNLTGGQFTSARFTSFDADGFTLSNNNETNDNGVTYVAWCWKGNAGTKSSNSNGSITSTVQVNDSAGFSIIEYTGANSSGTGTFGHGLSTAPTFFILRDLDGNSNWIVWANAFGDVTKNLQLQSNSQLFSSNIANSTAPSSTVISISADNDVNNDGKAFICYAFTDVAGYQKFGTYSGTGNAGNFINTGFEPAFLMIKRTNSTGGWLMFDNKRNTTNPRNSRLEANNTQAEQTGSTSKFVNFLSNGFEPQVSDSEINDSSSTYFYWAIAANPDTEAPTLASSFRIQTYTGTGGNRSIAGLGFGPGFVWLKNRDQNAYAPRIFDIVRGATNRLQSSTTATESSDSTSLTSFDADGFSLGSDAYVNNSGDDFVAWAFKADDNEPTINTNGTITSITSVNANAGFSIVKYHGNDGSSGTIGHGLSSAPELIITKALNFSAGWPTQAGGSFGIRLNEDGANQSGNGNGFYGNTSPTSTVYTVGGSDETNDDYDYIAYCFHSVAGYSKVGTYTGSTSGVTITTGFKPDFLLIKSTSNTEHWAILDTVRGNFKVIKPNTNDAESDSTLNTFTITSTGFSFPHQDTADAMLNENGYQYIYLAVAMNPTLNTTLANSFKPVTYTGTGAATSITGLGFQPDLVWMKDRGNTREHILSDSVRGSIREVSSDTADAEEKDRGVSTFDTDGFSLPDGNTNYNASSQNYVAWCWKAGNNYVSIIYGTNKSAIVNANTANGFSIIKYTGTSASSQSVGHGLTSTPELVMIKKLTGSESWIVWYPGASTTNFLELNGSSATQTGATWGGTHSSTVVNLQDGPSARSSSDGQEYIAYVWHSVAGFSKIGKYTGNGSSQNITGLGFQPDFVMNKAIDSSHDWNITDSARGNQKGLNPNTTAVEGAQSPFGVTFISDGFTVADNSGGGASVNGNGIEYLYMAFKMN